MIKIIIILVSSFVLHSSGSHFLASFVLSHLNKAQNELLLGFGSKFHVKTEEIGIPDPIQSNDETIRKKIRTFLFHVNRFNRFRQKRILKRTWIEEEKTKTISLQLVNCIPTAFELRIRFESARVERGISTQINTSCCKVCKHKTYIHIHHTSYGCIKTNRRFRLTMHKNKCVAYLLLFLCVCSFSMD